MEKDYFFRVAACGPNQCGGVRVDGVESRGMGFRTFVSVANEDPLREKWVLREVYAHAHMHSCTRLAHPVWCLVCTLGP